MEPPRPLTPLWWTERSDYIEAINTVLRPGKPTEYRMQAHSYACEHCLDDQLSVIPPQVGSTNNDVKHQLWGAKYVLTGLVMTHALSLFLRACYGMKSHSYCSYQINKTKEAIPNIITAQSSKIKFLR